MDFPNKKYRIIYADPPWSYKNKNTGGSLCSGASQKYNTMSLESICSLPVKEISDKNSILFLWGTTPLLKESLLVMDAWGFKYKTTFYWRKVMSLGMGYWFRGQVEFMLVGVRGKVPAFRSQHPNFIQSKVGKHSEKPKEVRDLIEVIADKHNLNPKVELFARGNFEGWDCWGDQI